jgi:hypothetical protein
MSKRSSLAYSRRHSSTVRTRRPNRAPVLGLRTGALIPALGFFLVILIGSISGARSTPALSPWQQKQLNTARAQPPSHTGQEMPVPPAHPLLPRQAGISNAPQTPFSPAIFKARNAWQGPVGSVWIIAYAGAQTNLDGTTGRGGLVIYTVGDFALAYVGTFLAPPGTTALTIIQVRGDQLRVQAASGRTLTFHLQSQQYQ